MQVRAKVQLTLLVDVSDVWGGDCQMSQVYKQAKESALLRATELFSRQLLEERRVTCIGSKVTATIVDQESEPSDG